MTFQNFTLDGDGVALITWDMRRRSMNIITVAVREELSDIDRMGAAAFVAKCEALATAHGERFAPFKLLLDLARSGETFYRRFAPNGRKAA